MLILMKSLYDIIWFRHISPIDSKTTMSSLWFHLFIRSFHVPHWRTMGISDAAQQLVCALGLGIDHENMERTKTYLKNNISYEESVSRCITVSTTELTIEGQIPFQLLSDCIIINYSILFVGLWQVMGSIGSVEKLDRHLLTIFRLYRLCLIGSVSDGLAVRPNFPASWRDASQTAKPCHGHACVESRSLSQVPGRSFFIISPLNTETTEKMSTLKTE